MQQANIKQTIQPHQIEEEAKSGIKTESWNPQVNLVAASKHLLPIPMAFLRYLSNWLARFLQNSDSSYDKQLLLQAS